MQRVIRDPLVHFLLFGALLFVAYYALNPPETSANDQIRITQNDIERFEKIFQKRWQRSPTQQELQGLISAYIKEEVLYREALEMGLEKDDTIVRRRLAQKVEFLITDLSVPAQVDDKTLRAFYENNTDRYTRGATFSFRHIYFKPAQRSESTLDEAEAALQTLQTTQVGLNVSDELGDRWMFDSLYRHRSTDEIAREFGTQFSEALDTLTTGSWQGPIRSGYGWHLVYIMDHESEGVYPLDQIRERVKNDYLYDLRQRQSQAVVEKLKSRYEIVIENS
ncbi:MAG: peptidylprolyl isomerase [Gammaproteobacteria bacterium]|jgi:hypothetical protein